MIRYFTEKPPALAQVQKLGFKTFKGKFDLNLIVCRSLLADRKNCFVDTLHVIHHNELVWQEFIFPCTSVPGSWWLTNSKRSDGVAILKHDFQYRSGYTFGRHRGTYECLVPTRQLPLWRDKNKDEIVDYAINDGFSASVNIHRAGKNSTKVDKWSAGCIVLQTGFDSFMELCKMQSEHKKGNTFTLTILGGIYL